MARYIDADKLKKDVLDLQDCYNGFSDTYDKACIIDVIDEQPSADVRENLRGEWVKHNCFYECSNCHCCFTYRSDFCPDCGAYMRERRTDGE